MLIKKISKQIPFFSLFSSKESLLFFKKSSLFINSSHAHTHFFHDNFLFFPHVYLKAVFVRSHEGERVGRRLWMRWEKCLCSRRLLSLWVDSTWEHLYLWQSKHHHHHHHRFRLSLCSRGEEEISCNRGEMRMMRLSGTKEKKQYKENKAEYTLRGSKVKLYLVNK